MNRISIDVTAEQHQQLKALAAIQGKSIKQFVLESTLGSASEADLATLETLLDRRLAGAQNRGGAASRSVDQIFQDANRKLSGEPQDD
ncbi:MAG: DUF1778 domain-containing protein [Planctomycetes bacterium]|nr:DUF1778 domain-containing protein [Planctomycetota bacterium]